MLAEITIDASTFGFLFVAFVHQIMRVCVFICMNVDIVIVCMLCVCPSLIFPRPGSLQAHAAHTS